MKNRIVCFLVLAFIPMISFSHGSHGSGFTAGFTHPVFGIDHNLAILGSGILGFLLDRKKWYLYPISFLVLMTVGGFVGVGQPPSSLAETIIALSIFSIGLLILIGGRIPFQAILALLAVFGFFHGYAHGIEKPEGTGTIIYVLGYSVGVVLLSSIGWSIARVIDSLPNAKIGYQVIGVLLISYSISMFL